jgi:hypothetical protein
MLSKPMNIKMIVLLIQDNNIKKRLLTEITE